jgi:hypothetical protein
LGRPVYFRGLALFSEDPPKPLAVIPPKIRGNNSLLGIGLGVKIASTDCTTNEVISVKCLFREKYGKEEDDGEGRKRKRTANVKYFRKPWRSDNLKSHMMKQHKMKYEEYLASDPNEKIHFLSSNSTFQPLNASNERIRFLVNRGIVDTLIGKLLIDPDTDDTDLNNPISALRIFELQEENNGDGGENVAAEMYLISIDNVLQFRLITSFISVGLSFRQCVDVIRNTKEEPNLGQIGCISMSKVIRSVRYLCTMNYQMLFTICQSVWAFSIAFDGGNKSDTSHLDVRLRFAIENTMHNFHLVALTYEGTSYRREHVSSYF